MENNNPLLPGYKFDLHLVAGLTPIHQGEILDFIIDRPNGMKGYILNLTTQGMGYIYSGKEYFSVKKGDLILFPPHIIHNYQRHPEMESWYHRWIYFRPRGYWKDFLQWEENIDGILLTRNIDQQSYHCIEKLFIDVEEQSKSTQSYSTELAENYLEQLLIRCKRLQPASFSRKIDARILQAINYMMDDIKQDYSINEIAAHVYLSPSRLIHLFSQEMGMSILKWRDDQRINYAKQLLFTTNIPIGAISRNVGFTDPLYFSRVFKKKVGVSPKVFRESFVENRSENSEVELKDELI
ncbi:arabinose operon transcriptional regulator AraC [Gallibacterium salpingitidis]|uniref:arabinose operon transcriptional regulator AraC n=1 Tax=Gallibacterium salpingitidis TaxID=505341 RepID=UPI00266F873D|nr:arabinose operon transcriptional regulator AraC [Gallibacterium salpingitidis]WKS99177.1 arabinose operon transcriptional regulator AraC [Gallibacterium salpingitidis]